jgi:hypothetical protein
VTQLIGDRIDRDEIGEDARWRGLESHEEPGRGSA